MKNFNSEFELKFNIKTDVNNMEDVLQVINNNIVNEFNKINESSTDIVVNSIVKKINDRDTRDKIADINQQIDELSNKGKITDGSHTFDELYYHRMVLFSLICSQNKENAWKSWLHSDGTMFDDYFIVGISTKEGDYSYHYHKDYWSYFTNVKELRYAPEWDGHKPYDVTRVFALLQK